MSIILLADDSPYAQRMGERILKGGRLPGSQHHSDGDTAVIRLVDVDPDLVIADAFLPGRSGIELCRYVKTHHRHTRVILTAGLLEKFDETAARQAGCDAILRKPFEASLVMQIIRPLAREAQLARGLFAECWSQWRRSRSPTLFPPRRNGRSRLDPQRVEAAVRLALDAALPALIREITEKVLIALGH